LSAAATARIHEATLYIVATNPVGKPVTTARPASDDDRIDEVEGRVAQSLRC